MQKYRRLTAFALVFGAIYCSSAHANEESIRAITYPRGQGIFPFTDEVVLPHFNVENRYTIVADEPEFALWDKLRDSRKWFLKNIRGYDIDELRERYKGSETTFWYNHFILADGTHVEGDGLSPNLIGYDAGAGLIVDFVPLPYKVYFGATNYFNVRAYTILPDGVYWDKAYHELDDMQRTVKNPAFAFILYDAAITGKFDPVTRLSTKEQELVVDILSIGIAEYYWAKRRYISQTPPKTRHAREAPFSRAVPFIGSAFFIQLYNHGGWQITGNGEEIDDLDRSEAQLTLKKDATIRSFYNGALYLTADQVLNERLITEVLRRQYPKEFDYMDKRLGNHHANNFLDMLALYAEDPRRYDARSRQVVRTILTNLPSLVPAINRELAQYLYFKTGKDMNKLLSDQ